MSTKQLLQCYNRGCGQEYDPEENTETSCTFHPGDPFFHDAYKGWSCCKRKCIDFTEFLNMKGCTTSFHSNIKPIEPEKKKEDVDIIEEIPQPVENKKKAIERPSSDLPLIDLKIELAASLQNQKFKTPLQEEANLEKSNTEISFGTKCKNKGCTEVYNGPESENGICKFHPGVPIFHEGLKFWSCCNKKTTDFQTFLDQKGCTESTHLWIQPTEDNNDQEGNKLIKCRHDWHQTASHVIVAIYAKMYQPKKSFFKANGVKLNIDLFFPEENGHFKQEWVLYGVIDPNESKVMMGAAKVEIMLRKAEPQKWKDIEILVSKINENKKEVNEIRSVGVVPVDLDDL